MMSIFEDRHLPEVISSQLANKPLKPAPDPWPEDFFDSPPRPAAVLMPLIRETDGWHLLFIRRSEHEKDRHSGEVAFPGGHIDPHDEGARGAALREAEEEIGLAPENVQILGSLDSYRTISNYAVTAVVGRILRPFVPRPDPREVQHVFTIPLEWLADPENRELRPRDLPAIKPGIDILYYRRYENELLWGITARLVEALVSEIGKLS